MNQCECRAMSICPTGVQLWNQAAAAFAYYDAQSYQIDAPAYRWAIRTYAHARRIYAEHRGLQLPWRIRPFAGRR